jgi:fermentation-respiration switch protein FrsA (DUF1100 family)
MIKKVILLTLFAALLFTGAAVAGVLWITHARAYAIVHPARQPITASPESIGIMNYQLATFDSLDGLTLKGWYMPSQNGAVIIFIHGHGGSRTGLADEALAMIQQGYGALVFDLRNNGESQGNVTTFGLLETLDVRGAVDFVKAQPGVDADRIGVLGQSMGGATAIMSAARIPEIRAVVAESAYTSMEDNITNGVQRLAGLPAFPFAPLVIFWGQREAGINISEVRPVDEIASLSPRPVLIVHGERDDLIPVENAHHLYQAAQEPKELYLIPNAGHTNFVHAGGEAYVQKIVEFFDRNLLGR